jgi:hypothetical protein
MLQQIAPANHTVWRTRAGRRPRPRFAVRFLCPILAAAVVPLKQQAAPWRAMVLFTLRNISTTDMKRAIIILTVLILATGVVIARRMAWKDTDRPQLSLPDAYDCAITALGTSTNQFYCVRAGCLISRSPDGEWLFTFANSRGSYKSVFVFFDKTTRIEDGLPKF